MCKEKDELTSTMDFLKEVVNFYLSQVISNKKFKGTIIIELNCIDGGIGNVATTVKKNYNKSDIAENSSCK